MTTRDKQLVLTINHKDSTTAVMLLREFIGPDGQWWPMPPIDASSDAAAIDVFAGSMVGTQQARIAELESQLSSMTAERDSLETEKTTLTTELDLLQDRIDELTAIAEQPICTNFQIRAWLITKFGLGIIDKVTAMIASIPDATQRLLANQQWEYANNVLRDNPFVEQIAAALGMKSDEMDAAYLEASKIV